MSSKTGTLYVVATPIGNLADITLRALELLRSVDVIACEDTRIALKLLNYYNIKKHLIAYHQHSCPQKTELILNKLKAGKDVALVTDAGTPGICDPGGKLVAAVVRENLKVVPAPGPSALTAFISIAGVDLQRFIFLGFPPHKKGRKKFFYQVSQAKFPVIYFESPYRLVKNLELLVDLAPQKKLVLGRELTKSFEEIQRGSPESILALWRKKESKVKGEVIILAYEEKSN